MKLIPILFSTPMVQAKLEGRKTMTRRTRGLDIINENPDDWEYIPLEGKVKHGFNNLITGVIIPIKCPYGQPGDILWTRETFFAGFVLDEYEKIPDNAELAYWYFADTQDARPFDASDEWCYNMYGSNKRLWPSWKPSIHMPFDVCRMFDKVTKIRVERLHDITEQDAIAEGIKSFRPVPGDGPAETLYYHYTKDKWGTSPIHSFETLWRKINGEESWNKNPWVWVVTFEKTEKP